MKLGFRELIFACVLIGILGSSYAFIFKVSNSRQAQLRSDIDLRRKELHDLRTATAGIDDLDSRIKKLGDAISFFERKLPREKEMDKILREVSRIAEDNALRARSIKTLKTERTAHFCEQPFQMTLAGDFNGFYAFLLQLERMQRITRVSQMNLQKIADQDGQMTAQVTLSIFFEPDENKQ